MEKHYNGDFGGIDLFDYMRVLLFGFQGKLKFPFWFADYWLNNFDIMVLKLRVMH